MVGKPSSNAETADPTFDWRQIQPIRNPQTEGTKGLDPTGAHYKRRENVTYNEVLAQGNQFCSAIAYVRWRVLEMSRPAFGQAIGGVDKNSMGDIENAKFAPFAHLRYKLYNKMVPYLEENLPEPLKPLIGFIVDHLLGENRDRIYGIFQEGMYRIGPEMLQELEVNLPALRFRRDSDSLTPHALIEQLDDTYDLHEYGMSREKADGIWLAEATRIYCEVRGVPEPLAQLHMNDEMLGLNTFSRKETRTGASTKRSPAYRLARFQMPPLEDVTDIIATRIDPDELDDFMVAYEAAYEAERKPPLYWETLRKTQQRNEVTDQMIKRMLQLPTDMRPSSFLLDPTIEGKDLPNTIAPPAILAHLVSNSPEEATYLISLYRENRTRYRKRMAVSNAGNELRLDREQWGVSCRDIEEWIYAKLSADEKQAASAAGVLPDLHRCWEWSLTARQINKWENGQEHLAPLWDTADEKKHALNEDGTTCYDKRAEVALEQSLRRIVDFLGQRKLASPLNVKATYREPQTVPDAVIRGNDLTGARVPWEYRWLQNHCREVITGDITYNMMNRHTLRRIADEIEVPCWPFMKQVLSANDIAYTDDPQRQLPWMKALKRDWQLRLTKQLAGQVHVPQSLQRQYPKNHPVPKALLKPKKWQPLARVLKLSILEQVRSTTRLAQRTDNPNVNRDVFTECMQICNTPAAKLARSVKQQELWEEEWDTITQILRAADVPEGSPRWLFVECLFDEQQNVASALRQWAKLVPADDQRLEDLAGLLPEEIALCPRVTHLATAA